MIDLSELLEQTAGFPRCGRCVFQETGAPWLCFACASEGMTAPDDDRCPICDQTLPPSGECGNNWCAEPVEIRYFDRVWAIAKHTGALKGVLGGYKYRNKHGWAQILARILVGYLDSLQATFGGYSHIVGVPGFVEPPRQYDPVSLILERAQSESGGRWPFDVADPPIIMKTGTTPSMVDAGGLHERKVVAKTQLRPALQIPDEKKVDGQRILVFDDVFTEGSTLREVARALLASGATEVSGIVLARQPWT